jgi:hypothetical protein
MKNSCSHSHSLIMLLTKSVWTFPLILLLALFVLTAFKIHGSSVGVYHQALYGTRSEDPDLLYGEPREIRSDEWLGWTQYTFLQSETGFPTFNQSLGSGRDVSKNNEIPVSNWIGIFRPNNWSFFFLPLEHAFAFKWWFIMFLLILSCYFFVLRLLPGRILLAILFSVSFALSPFMLWWYQSALFLILAYGFWILLVSMRIIDQKKILGIQSKRVTNLLYTVVLSFLAISSGLTLYPPYFIPIVIVCAVFIAGYLLNARSARSSLTLRPIAKRITLLLTSAVIAGTVGLVFISQHREMIERTASSIYPGSRVSPPGELSYIAIFDGFLMPVLQNSSSEIQYYANQSEASNFILLLPFLIIPGLLLQAYEYMRSKKIDWVFTGLHLCILLFLAKAFIPFGDSFYSFLLLDRVPGVRLLAGIGFLGMIYLLLMIKKADSVKLPKKIAYPFAGMYGLLCFAVLFVVGLKVMELYPAFLESYAVLAALALGFTAIVVAFTANKPRVGAILLLTFTLLSSYKILPIYQGLDILEENKIIQSIKENSDPDDYWITTDDLLYSNFPIVAGRGLVSGSQQYPDLEYWEPIGDGKYEDVYNRQARSVFLSTLPPDQKMNLVAKNFFTIRLECSPFVHEKVDYVLAVTKLDQPCLEHIDTITYPKRAFHIYRILSK